MCRTAATYFMIMDEGPDGPTEEQKAFIRRYNTRVYEGFITILENLPFILHRYYHDVIASCGLVLFEQPIFYIVCFILIQIFCENLGELLLHNLLYVLDWIDDMGLMMFIIMSLVG